MNHATKLKHGKIDQIQILGQVCVGRRLHWTGGFRRISKSALEEFESNNTSLLLT
jgi:hypothetical protein